jgi:ABC-type cobalt transport system substrate-binding protein
MMKKKLIGLLLVLFVLGATTIAFAQVDENGAWSFSFEQMLPYMQKMHPDWSEGELQQMYEDCHGPNGAASGMGAQGMSRMMGF